MLLRLGRRKAGNPPVIPVSDEVREMSVELSNNPKSQSRAVGQGVVEYSGAVIVAVLLVASAMGGGVDGLSNLFAEIITATHNLLGGHLPA
ncbi:MAG TPA: hypothetical protein V6C52_02765 [Coleofasciculaceae cyanobacterium]|jgi:hypothetical protein